MALIVIVICLLVQRVLMWEVNKPHLAFFIKYTAWLEMLCNQWRIWQGLGGVFFVFASIAALYVMVIGVLGAIFGVVFLFLWHLCVLWFYLDAKPLVFESVHPIPLNELFMNRYHAIFAVLFWYLVLGPLGVIFYCESRRLEFHLKQEQKSDVYFSEEFLQKLMLVRSMMDWVPVRLLGLTYALIGQFRPAFTFWCSHFAGLQSEPLLVVDYGMIALNWDPKLVLSRSEQHMMEMRGLTNRALIVWLVVIAIFT